MNFHILTYDSDREDVSYVEDYEFGDFDIRLLRNGTYFSGTIPPDVRLFVADDDNLLPSDYLANPLSWPIMSQRMQDILWPLIKGDVQLIDPPLFRRSTGEPVSGYKLVNVLRLVDCIDLERSQPPPKPGKSTHTFNELWLKASRVGDVHIFRCLRSHYRVIFDDPLAQSLAGKGMRGIAFIRVRSS